MPHVVVTGMHRKVAIAMTLSLSGYIRGKADYKENPHSEGKLEYRLLCGSLGGYPIKYPMKCYFRTKYIFMCP